MRPMNKRCVRRTSPRQHTALAPRSATREIGRIRLEVPAHRPTEAARLITPPGPRRRPLPQALPRVEQVIDLPEQDKQCECGHRLVRIGEDTSEKVDVIPPQVQVIRTVRPRYACDHCEGSGDEEHPAVRVAPPPAALIPKGLASEGLLAFIATAKFCDARSQGERNAVQPDRDRQGQPARAVLVSARAVRETAPRAHSR